LLRPFSINSEKGLAFREAITFSWISFSILIEAEKPGRIGQFWDLIHFLLAEAWLKP
jgi:hypothetical protein